VTRARFPDRHADLLSAAFWCSDVPSAVHTHRCHPVPLQQKLLTPIVCLFLLSDFLLLDVAPFLSLVHVHGTIYLPSCPGLTRLLTVPPLWRPWSSCLCLGHVKNKIDWLIWLPFVCNWQSDMFSVHSLVAWESSIGQCRASNARPISQLLQQDVLAVNVRIVNATVVWAPAPQCGSPATGRRSFSLRTFVSCLSTGVTHLGQFLRSRPLRFRITFIRLWDPVPVGPPSLDAAATPSLRTCV